MIATIHRLSAPNTVFKDQHAYHVEREFVRVTGGSGLIENVSAVALGDTERPNLPTGIKFQDGGTDWTVRRARMSGFAMRPIEGRYRNGDGFSTELPNARIRFEACQGNGNGDAGFDLKGPDWHLDDCTAERNAHNFRFWSTGVAGRIRSVEPMVDGLARGRPLHVHICPAREHTDRQVIRIDSLFARGPGWLLFVETRPESPPPQIVIASHDVEGVTEVVRSTGPAPEVIWSSGAPKR